jgi:ABC-type Co2+ transport system permease subunit
MMFVHLIVAGVVEGVVTALTLKFIASQSPDLIFENTINCKEA